jgi:hypothetical protein
MIFPQMVELTKMPLTRNLYREDEVLTALKWSILKGRLKESVFWGQEAIDSELTLEVLQILFYIWMSFVGSANLPWFYSFCETISNLDSLSEDDIHYCIITLAMGPKDSTVFTLLGLGFGPCEETHTGFAILPKSLASLKGRCRVFATTLKLGKLPLAWSFIREWSDEMLYAMTEVGTEKHGEQFSEFLKMLSLLEANPIWKPEWTWFIRSLTVVIAGSKESIMFRAPRSERKELPIEVRIFYRDLKSIIGQRQKRIYKIPQDCLYWFTERGTTRVNQTNEDELIDGLENALQGSSFWDQHLEAINSDREREHFYDTFFNTDIPDEWSKADRQKSHGGGCVPLKEEGDKVNFKILLGTTLDRWFQIPSRGIWNGLELALKNFKGEWLDPVDIEEAIHKKYLVISKSLINLNVLEPKPMQIEFEVCC